jgi:hypothetical protein
VLPRAGCIEEVSMKVALEVISLVVIGWVAGAETGSWYGVQPVVQQLAYRQ